MLGTYSPQILLLRLEETLAGALSGAAVAVMMMPVSLGAALRQRTAEALRAVAQFLSASSAEDPAGRTRTLDRKLQAARNSARSLDESLLARLVPRVVQALDALTAIVYEARSLVLFPAGALAPATVCSLPPGTEATLRQLNSLAAELESPPPPVPSAGAAPAAINPLNDEIHGLERLHRELQRLRRCFRL
jgi:uncharacterized membrane protein YccC